MFRCHADRPHGKTSKSYVCGGQTRNRSVSACLGWTKGLQCSTVKVKRSAIPTRVELLLRQSWENPCSLPETHSALTAQPVSDSKVIRMQSRLASRIPSLPSQGQWEPLRGTLPRPQGDPCLLWSPDSSLRPAATASSSLEKKRPRSTCSESVCNCAGAWGVQASVPAYTPRSSPSHLDPQGGS